MRYEDSRRNQVTGIEEEVVGGIRQEKKNSKSIQNMLNLKKQKTTKKTGTGTIWKRD